MQNSIGGFFATLGIKTDTASFDKSKNALENVSNSVSRMLGVVRNASTYLGQLTLSVGEMGSAEMKVANYLGISSQKLDDWRNAAKLASVDANALVGDMSALETKLARINQGIVPNDMATAFGFLGLQDNLITFTNKSMEERVQSVFEAARKLGNQTNAADLVGQILGSGFKDLYLSGIVQREGFGSLFAQAQGLNYTSDKTALQADLFNTEKNAFTTAVENMQKYLGGEIADKITPYLQGINNWIGENGTTIKDTLTSFAKNIEALLTSTSIFNSSLTAELIGISEKINLLIPEKVLKKLYDVGSTIIQSPTDFAIGIAKTGNSFLDIFTEQTKEGKVEAAVKTWNNFIDTMRYGFTSEKNPSIQDGIISPGGRITKVAPDDWVFAARNLSDMAGAFIPHSFNSQAAKNDIVINQTINVTGNNDTHTIRQQARLGLTDALQQATRYAQMMPQLN